MSVDGVEMEADHVMRVLSLLPLPLPLVLWLLQRLLVAGDRQGPPQGSDSHRNGIAH